MRINPKYINAVRHSTFVQIVFPKVQNALPNPRWPASGLSARLCKKLYSCAGLKILMRWALLAIMMLPALVCGQSKDTVVATRISRAPVIDGILDDACWQQTIPYQKFYESQPRVGVPDTTTLLMLVYDDDAIYVGVHCHQPQDPVWMQLTLRDDVVDNSDGFYIGFDTYRDGQNAFAFGVTPRNVQGDARGLDNTEWDDLWDAVWYSKTSLQPDGWTAELKIPFSELRFPRRDTLVWGFDCYRVIRNSRRELHSSNYNPAAAGLISQWQPLVGLNGLKPPLRLSAVPYGSYQLNLWHDPNTGQRSSRHNLRGGMDLKWGINESFTLDATLIPDFSQVQSDDVVYNLSAIEVRYDERRPFFTEGTELFNKADLFYSRRIGYVSDYFDYAGSPEDSLLETPQTSRLLNAVKFSGRTAGKLGIGLFNATTAPVYARARAASQQEQKVLFEPLANYNVLVLDQALPQNSYVNFTNTLVVRSAGGRDANVSALMTQHYDRRQRFALFGRAALSTLKQSPGPGLADELNRGLQWELAVEKVSGNFTAMLSHQSTDDHYDSNDLGYLELNNQNQANLELNYDIYEPFGAFNELHTSHDIIYRYRYTTGRYIGLLFRGNYFMMTRRFFGFFFYYLFQPAGYHDYEEPRAGGEWYYAEPPSFRLGGGISTDYRKRLALDIKTGPRFWQQPHRYEVYNKTALRIRAGNRLLLIPETEITWNHNDEGWVANAGGYIWFGRRNVLAVANLITADYAFTATLSSSLKIRHYNSAGLYKSFYTLNTDGSLSEALYEENADFNYTAWNVDWNVTWWLRPGSQLNVVWKQAITGISNHGLQPWPTRFAETFRLPQGNTLLLELRYYLDYAAVRGWWRPKARSTAAGPRR